MSCNSGAPRISPVPVLVLLAPAGSGKTEVLGALARRGEQVIDIERLAGHRGSAFGASIEGRQPTHGEFERALRRALARADPRRTLWLEHEARSLGSVGLPGDLLRAWSQSDGVVLQVARARRIERLVAEYAPLGMERLLSATARIARRLGEARTERVLSLLLAGHLPDAAAVLVDYYDEAYADQLARRTGRVIMTLDAGDLGADQIAAAACAAMNCR